MKRVKVGRAYLANIRGKVRAVRIEWELQPGTWGAINLETGRMVKITSPAMLLEEIHEVSK